MLAVCGEHVGAWDLAAASTLANSQVAGLHPPLELLKGLYLSLTFCQSFEQTLLKS